MTKAAALYSFWSSFGIPAYEENSVPKGEFAPEFPYITYELVTDGLMHEAALSASVWYRSTSLVDFNAKTEEISKAIGFYKTLACDNGVIVLRQGNPFAQTMGDDTDSEIRRKYLNLTAEFITQN